MTEAAKVRLTCEEGQNLLNVASSFMLPEKLGDTNFSVADRAIAGDEVRRLYRELKAYSPMTLKPERWILFGPADNFTKTVTDRGQEAHRMVDLVLEVEMRLDDDAMSGLAWCLLVALHPSSERVLAPAGVQEDILWPLAAKVGRTKAIRELIGFSKGTPRRWKVDSEYEKDEKKAEEKKSP